MKKILPYFLLVVFTGIQISCSKYVDTRTNSSSSGSSTTTPGTGSGSGTGTGGGSGSTPGTGGGAGATPGTGGGSGTGSGTTPGPTPPGTTPPSSGGTTSDSIYNVGFDTLRTNVCDATGETFTFTSTTKNVAASASYEWYFGDGKTQTGTNIPSVKKQYDYNNSYTVQMKILYKGVYYTATKNIKAYGQNQIPQASFNVSVANPNSGGNTYYFNASNSKGPSGGSINNYAWDFGDGTSSSGAGKQTISHTYTQKPVDQSFTVKLVVTGTPSGCTDIATASGIDVAAKYSVSGTFNISSTDACLPSHETFTFTPNYTGVPSGAEYKWEYSDGSPADYGQTATHIFLYKNFYTVKLTISYNGSVLYSEQKSVNSKGQETTPSVSVYSQYTNPTTYSYNANTSIGGGWAITTYAWDFGDGTTDTNPSVKDHVFPKSTTAKTYTISLKVTSNSGCSASDNVKTNVPAN